VILTSNQDGRQAKNRKRGDEIKKKSSPLKLLSQSFFLICIIDQNRQKLKVHKNHVIYVKKLIIMLIQFKFFDQDGPPTAELSLT
jgi:hypothetical protein